MSRLVWDSLESAVFRSGVDRGVVFPRTVPPTVWNGLVSVSEKTTDAGQTEAYYDGYKYVKTVGPESFAASVEAITYPEALDVDDEFDLSYRTLVNDGYELHLVYNAALRPAELNYASADSNLSLSTFKWDMSTIPERLDTARACAHIVISSSDTAPDVLTAVEGLIYGVDGINPPRIPHLPELIDMFEAGAIFKVIDNGDGTWTATGPDSMIEMLDSTTFQITSPSAIYLDAATYKLSTW